MEQTISQQVLAAESQSHSAQRMYDKRAAKYDDSWHPTFARRMVEYASLKPDHHVLDLACGTGLATIPAAQAVPNGHVVAIDVSAGMLDELRKKVQREGLSNVNVLKHDIARVDELQTLTKDHFDVIIMASALVLLTDEDRLRGGKIWADMLKPGGVFVVDVATPYNQTPGIVLERTAKKLGLSIPYNRDWVKDEKSFSKYLEDAGFIVEELIPVAQTGEETRFVGVDEADHFFDEQLKGEHARALADPLLLREYGFAIERVQETFREEWNAIAVDGQVKIEDRVWVAIARKQGR